MPPRVPIGGSRLKGSGLNWGTPLMLLLKRDLVLIKLLPPWLSGTVRQLQLISPAHVAKYGFVHAFLTRRGNKTPAPVGQSVGLPQHRPTGGNSNAQFLKYDERGRQGGREGGRKEGRKGGREEGKKERKKTIRKEGSKGRRERRGKEGRKEDIKKRRKQGKEGGKKEGRQ
ncbi:priB, partial [Ophiophagus hannah]